MKHRLPATIALLLGLLPAVPAATTVRAQEPATATRPMLGVGTLPEGVSDARPLPRPDPKLLFDQATTMLARRHSIVAKLRYQADLFGRTIVGAGDYVQGTPSSRLMRYEVRMQFGDRQVHQLQVNNGRYLWQQRQYQSEPELQRIDVERVLAARPVAGGPGGEAATVLGLGGLGRLIETLRKDFEFVEVFRSELKSDPADIAVYGIEGRWRPEALKSLHLDSPAKLRSHVPDRVVIYLGCDDSFPYRIEYLREVAATEPNAPAQTRPLLVLELLEVQFDAPLDESQFNFTAGSRPFTDVTDRFLAAEAKLP